VICRKNELGWHLHKHMGGYAIRQANVPVASRLWQFGPVLVNLALIAALHVGADTILRCTLYAVPVVLLLLWLVAGQLGVRLAWAGAPALLIFLGLLAKDTMDPRIAYGTLPFSFLISLWFFRPTELWINVRSRLVMGRNFSPQLPFSHLMIEIRHDADSEAHSVYLKDTEPSSASNAWEVLAWKGNTEVEASAIADEFRDWRIGTPDVPVTNAVIKADKKLRLLVGAGYIAAVVVFIALLVGMIHGRQQAAGEMEPEALLQVVRLTMAFLFLSPAPLALYLCWLGRRAIQHRQMPPPGMKLIIDTKPLAGEEAVTRGRLLTRIGVALIIVGLVVGLYVPQRLARTLGAQTGPATSSVNTQIWPTGESQGLISSSSARACSMMVSPAPWARWVPRVGS
jgi:hypothetical protein